LKNKKLHHHNNHQHIPVLFEDTVRLLDPRAGESYLDLTAGYGGHAQAILDKTGSPSLMVLNDRDSDAIKHLAAFKRLGATLIQDDFYSTVLDLGGQRQFDMILADLGVSSPHFDKADRGFSFSRDGPLDMRMDQSQELTAAVIVNDWPEADLAKVIADFGQQPQAARLARAIIQARPIGTTGQLADVVQTVLGRHGKRHPATKTFQALRIAVNDELNQLEKSLPLIIDLLAPGGRLAVISFHSLEDRLVKRFFKDDADSGYEARLKLLTKHAIRGTDDVHNPRARSARLRAVVKIKNQKEGGS